MDREMQIGVVTRFIDLYVHYQVAYLEWYRI